MKFARRFRIIVTVAAIAALLFSGTSFFLRSTTPPAYSLVDQTTLSVLKGRVEYLRAGESLWVVARKTEVLQVGDRIRTGPDSNGLITFFEGTSTEIEPESEVEVTRLEKPEESGEIGLALKQALGTTWTRVAKIADVRSKMEIETPSAVAMVRGTEFAVTVTREEKTEVVTSMGQVDVMGQGEVVPVQAGFLSVVEPGKPPAPPVPAPPPKRTLTISLQNAGRLFVTDSRGRSLGFFPETGSYLNQIPGAWYSGSRSEPQVIALPDPSERYRITISPGPRQPAAAASGGALVAGWYSGMERDPAPKWVGGLLAEGETTTYSGSFRVDLGVFLDEQQVSGKSAEGVLGADEIISFEASLEGDDLRGNLIFGRQAMTQSAGGVAPQVIAKREVAAPDPLAVAKSAQELAEKASKAVVVTPPRQFQTVVMQTAKPDPEAQKSRLEKVLREAAGEADRYAREKKAEEQKAEAAPREPAAGTSKPTSSVAMPPSDKTPVPAGKTPVPPDKTPTGQLLSGTATADSSEASRKAAAPQSDKGTPGPKQEKLDDDVKAERGTSSLRDEPTRSDLLISLDREALKKSDPPQSPEQEKPPTPNAKESATDLQLAESEPREVALGILTRGPESADSSDKAERGSRKDNKGDSSEQQPSDEKTQSQEESKPSRGNDTAAPSPSLSEIKTEADRLLSGPAVAAALPLPPEQQEADKAKADSKREPDKSSPQPSPDLNKPSSEPKPQMDSPRPQPNPEPAKPAPESKPQADTPKPQANPEAPRSSAPEPKREADTPKSQPNPEPAKSNPEPKREADTPKSQPNPEPKQETSKPASGSNSRR